MVNPLSDEWEDGMKLQILKKWVQDQVSIFRWGLLGKRGCSFSINNKLNSDIFNDKRVYIQNFFSVLIKILN